MVPTVVVEMSGNRIVEREYILHVMFSVFLGVSWRLVTAHRPDARITVSDCPGELLLPEKLLSLPESDWLVPESLPPLPLPVWDSSELVGSGVLTCSKVPVVYGDLRYAGPWGKRSLKLPLDIFGTAFFMLAQYDEMILPGRDQHSRFPAQESIACKAGFLERPIVDEYTEILWACMKRLWPCLQRKKRHARINVTCDLDHPYMDDCNTVLGTVRHAGGDLIKRYSWKMAAQTLGNRRRRRRGDYSRDPYLQAVDWIMSVNEQAGNSVAFYIIASCSRSKMDGDYSLDERPIRSLLKRIHARGHEIGLHGSYSSFRDEKRIGQEADELRRVLEIQGISQSWMGSRQHFLRWAADSTPRDLERAGLDYDSTLCYPSRLGFRCGTSHEFPMFDLVRRKPLALRQRPLILMECSVIDKPYMGLGYSEQALALMLDYKRICRKFGGAFTLLWHNNHLSNDEDRWFYRELIA